MASPKGAAEPSATSTADLETKIFVVRGGEKLLRHIVFAKEAGLRPNALRVTFGASHETAFTLKNASFARQYHRAVEKGAAFYSLLEGDPLRVEMESTARDFLTYYNLRTQPCKFQRQGELREIDDVAIPNDASGDGAPPAPPDAAAVTPPKAVLDNGLVRGITYRSAKDGQPPRIHVRLWRGKGFSLTLENVSFAGQYAKAVNAMADSLGVAPDDPLRARMHETGPAFLRYHGLATAAITIPDVVVVDKTNEQF